MSLTIRFDHRSEALADAAVDWLTRPTPDPIAASTVLVPSLGVGRWFQGRFAARVGVCARVETTFAGRYLWQLIGRFFPGLSVRSPFEPYRTRWVIYRLLSVVPDDVDMAPLRDRVAHCSDVERLVLAESIARTFDRYASWRRDWLVAWEQMRWIAGTHPVSVHEPWQRWLWRSLLSELGLDGQSHPFDRLAEQLRDHPDRLRATLGHERLVMFGAPAMSPDQFALVAQLSAVMDVGIFASNPCREFWEDLLDSRMRERLFLEQPEQAWLYEGEPSILGDWGRARRDFVAQVSTLQESLEVQISHPSADMASPWVEGAELPDELNVLQALQAAVFLRSDEPWSRISDDTGIEIHAAHSTLRQAEVLHERLLDLFGTLPGLRPQDVLILCADLESAADTLCAVVARAPQGERLPLTVSGRERARDPVLMAAIDWMSLAADGVPIAGLSAWLEQAPVMQAFGFDPGELSEFVQWLAAAGARMGIDTRSTTQTHSWPTAIDRLMLGASMAPDADVFGGLALAERWHESDLGEPLARLLALLELASELTAIQHRSLKDWCELLQRWSVMMFGHINPDADRSRVLRETIGDLLQSASGSRAEEASPLLLDLEAFSRALSSTASAQASAGLPGGAITVCPMGSLQGIAYRVICLFGFDEHAWPIPQPRTEYDLMPLRPRFGDRSDRHEGRAAFLDALLAAQSRLLIVYQGRSPRDDSPLNPAQVVSELRNYLGRMLGEARMRGLCHMHPLYGHSPRNFQPTALTGRSRLWFASAKAIASSIGERIPGLDRLQPIERPGVSLTALPGVTISAADTLADANGAITAERLLRILSRPGEWFFERALGARLPHAIATLPEREPLHDSDLDRRTALTAATIERLLDGHGDTAVLRWLRAQVSLPGGRIGEVIARALLDEAWQLVNSAYERPTDCRDALASRTARVPISIHLVTPDRERVIFRADTSLLPDGQPLRHISAYPLGINALLRAWIEQCVRMCRALSPTSIPAAVLAVPGRRLLIRVDDAPAALAMAVQAAARIAREPLPLLPKSYMASRGFAESDAAQAASGAGDDEDLSDEGSGKAGSGNAGDADLSALLVSIDDKTRRKALEKLHGGHSRTGEVDSDIARAVHRDEQPRLDEVILAGEAIWGQVLRSVREDKAS